MDEDRAVYFGTLPSDRGSPWWTAFIGWSETHAPLDRVEFERFVDVGTRFTPWVMEILEQSPEPPVYHVMELGPDWYPVYYMDTRKTWEIFAHPGAFATMDQLLSAMKRYAMQE